LLAHEGNVVDGGTQYLVFENVRRVALAHELLRAADDLLFEPCLAALALLAGVLRERDHRAEHEEPVLVDGLRDFLLHDLEEAPALPGRLALGETQHVIEVVAAIPAAEEELRR